MNTNGKSRKLAVKIYHGYGHKHNLVVYGHVFKNGLPPARKYTNNILSNIWHLLKLFFVVPVADIRVQLLWNSQVLNGVTEKDGFFKFEWESQTDVPAGWHTVAVNALNDIGEVTAAGEGKIFVPHVTQYAFISDIDDTVLISHSATVFRRLRTLFTKNPRSRKAFKDVTSHYNLLARAHVDDGVFNPFFYVSSSEWNLYDDLVDFFRHNNLPDGTFLLSQFKKWYQLFKTGKTKHEGKLIRVYRILDAFPKQQFVLLGDNSQADPTIYGTIAGRHPQKIAAIYIRNIVKEKEAVTKMLLDDLQKKGIATCLFNDNTEAISHAQQIGLLQPSPSNSQTKA